LRYRQTIELLGRIMDLGMGTGLSTNGSCLTPGTLSRLRNLGLGAIQVSMDAPDGDLAAEIRGHPDAYRDAMRAIRSLREFAAVTVSTVVSAHNFELLDRIIEVCRPEGVERFKFFPQKQSGRAAGNGAALSDHQVREVLPGRCRELAVSYCVEVETLEPSEPCGSASSGFAIDQHGDLYPCIFGVGDQAQSYGNVDGIEIIEEFWFSERLDRFRQLPARPCRRCETTTSGVSVTVAGRCRR
jgi:radical SAM protein with 4Fe4S-binding SPASM domain